MKKNIFVLFLVAILLVQCDSFPMNFPKSLPTSTPKVVDESTEFEALMEKDKVDKKQRTADILTYLLNTDDPKDPKAGFVVYNKSNCNMILRISGDNYHYDLPIFKNENNFVILKKGNYTLQSNICTKKYYTQKNIDKTYIINLYDDN